MGEREFAEMLIEMFGEAELPAKRFYDAGVLTTDEGIVAEDYEGNKFQITIKRC